MSRSWKDVKTDKAHRDTAAGRDVTVTDADAAFVRRPTSSASVWPSCVSRLACPKPDWPRGQWPGGRNRSRNV